MSQAFFLIKISFSYVILNGLKDPEKIEEIYKVNYKKDASITRHCQHRYADFTVFQICLIYIISEEIRLTGCYRHANIAFIVSIRYLEGLIGLQRLWDKLK